LIFGFELNKTGIKCSWEIWKIYWEEEEWPRTWSRGQDLVYWEEICWEMEEWEILSWDIL